MARALGVLSALTEHQRPTPTDIAELQALAPFWSSMPIDKLACEVIQQAIRNRAEIKPRAAGS